MRLTGLLCLTLALAVVAVSISHADQWYKGSLHFHSLWSDGDAPPEVPVAWYRENGWHFACITDHNVIPEGERFRAILEDGAPTFANVEALREQFCHDWVEVAEVAGRPRIRLKNFDELRDRFEVPGTFLLIPGEEITTIGSSPHVNALNATEVIGFSGSGDVADKANAYLEAVHEQQQATGKPMIATLNHPNHSDGVTIEEALRLPRLRYFEVYNGHPSVNNWGHEGRGYPPTDRFWDVVLSMRLLDDPGFMLYGVATDDAHNYYDWRTGQANPGRGWVMVKAPALDVETLFAAMDRGEFYASTGVILDDIERGNFGLAFAIVAEPGVSYTTRFIGTRRGFSTASEALLNANGETPPRASRRYSDDTGTVLLETDDLAPKYVFAGEELYVRAVVISDKPQKNPFKEGDVEMAWVQPVLSGK